MTQNSEASFGKLRSAVWPVHNYELKKLIPMLIMAFCISFNYTILRDTKDTIIVSAISAEAIPFLKLWGTVPCAILFMLIYSKLSNGLSKEKLFYVTIAPFILFFGLFPILIYPFRDAMHPHATADYLLTVLPNGLAGLVGCFRNWTYAVFYIGSELWGSAVLSLMFWGFANEIVKTKEAKRFYTIFTLFFNIALMFSGPCIYYFSQLGEGLAREVRWQTTLNYLMGMFVVSSLLIVAAYWWMNKNVLTDKRFYDPEEGTGKKKKSKPKMSIGESLKFLASSKYLRNIAILVIGYGMSINLVEVVWKSQLKIQFPTENEYSAFMGIFSTVTGFITVLMTFVGGNIIRRTSWGKAAMLTPLALLVTGSIFFAFVLFKSTFEGFAASMGTTTVFLAVMLGMFQNIASKSTKYSLFDPTKEMSYIPLDQESKVKGKAAIDVVGARLGKSGGALFYNVMIPMLGGLAAVTPLSSVLVIGVILAWMNSVRSLNTQYNELTGEDSSTPSPSNEPATAKA
ncbi:MAG: NTP/NDP exchange transporter [Chlamydiota bacterium]|nr:NTP/NDP exchange transporter [Chlamydiota bacterium]